MDDLNSLKEYTAQISVVVRLDQKEKLKKYDNQSKVVREALDMYFEQEDVNK